ncbi:hypothetical protein K439DRAFT_1622384 [Ramaria rubella]|nr:hypothetical protein K439DRAFT_1622384 [Ramaria rubella]
MWEENGVCHESGIWNCQWVGHAAATSGTWKPASRVTREPIRLMRISWYGTGPYQHVFENRGVKFVPWVCISDQQFLEACVFLQRQHNFDIHPSLPCGNLTIETCVNACGTAGFLLAGIEFTDKCYCRDKLKNNSKGNPEEFCGGPYLLSLAFLMNDSDS